MKRETEEEEEPGNEVIKQAWNFLYIKYVLFDSLENCTPVFLGSVGRWPSSAVAAVPKSIHKMKQ